MRLSRVDLIRYGRFTDKTLSFPRAKPDIHFIYGPNEAGKSTSLAAIEDLLFGFEHSTRYDFIHDKNALRVGAEIEDDHRSLEIVRRKGNKNTLLGSDGGALKAGDAALTPLLAGATREFFARMMSLDHERLTRGGQELLEPQNELGQMLFTAGTGLSHLRNRLTEFQKEADDLWSPRRASHRKYYIALDAKVEAERSQREHTITATKWNELKRAYDEAQAAYDSLLRDIQTRSAEMRKLSRIRRVYRAVRQLSEFEQEFAGLGKRTDLPDDAEKQLTVALQGHADAQSKIELLEGELAQLKAARDELQCNEVMLGHADAIEQLHQLRIEVQKERADLPKRRAELAAREDELREHAEALGWTGLSSQAIQERLPSRAHIREAVALLNYRGERFGALSSAREAHSEAVDHLKELQDTYKSKGDALNVSALSAALSEARALAGVGAQIEAAEAAIRESETKISTRWQALRPDIASESRLATIAVPPRAVIEGFRESLKDLDQRTNASQTRLKDLEREISRLRQAYEQRGQEHEGLAPEALRAAREERDSGWQLIRRKYIEGQEVPELEVNALIGALEDVPTAYETRVRTSDALADRRFELAEAAGEIALLGRRICDQELELDKVRNEALDLSGQREAIENKWRETWVDSNIQPLSPESMLEWLTIRAEILTHIEARETARSQLAELQRKQQTAKSQVLDELAALGEDVEALRNRSLSVATEEAETVQQRQQAMATEKSRLTDQIVKTEAEVTRKSLRFQNAQRQCEEWQNAWHNAASALGFNTDLSTDLATDRIGTLGRMRELVGEMSSLRRDRIAKIEQDIETYQAAVKKLVHATSPDLAARDVDAAALTIDVRLAEARKIREQQSHADISIKALKKRLAECEETRNSALELIRTLQTLAGVENLEALKDAIRRAARRRDLQSRTSEINSQLALEGDGLPLSELRSECDQVDVDQVASREETVQQEIENRQKELAAAADRRAIAQTDFTGLGGASAAANAAAERQEALSSLRNVAERYIRAHTSATVLRWAIDRFRLERQAPLLSRAGAIFAQLTHGAYTGLRVEFDDKDQPRLTGVRADQTAVHIQGMSDGTADQLYLALRLGSVEEFVSSSKTLPFIADDLLINFDDRRATAALKVLSEMGTKTQVLFFTHHQHLVEIARDTLGQGVNIISITD